MANFFFLVHSRMVFHWHVQELSFPGLRFRLHLISSPCPSCLCLPCQSSVGGLLSSPSAPVPISGLEMPPTQPPCWWLAAVPDLIAGKAAVRWYVVSRHHMLELLGGRKLWCWKFLTAVVKAYSSEAWQLGWVIHLWALSAHRGAGHFTFTNVCCINRFLERNWFSTVTTKSRIALRWRVWMPKAEGHWVQILTPPLPGWIILGKIYTHPVPQFPDLLSGDNS